MEEEKKPKQLYWIDDDFAQMFYIIHGVISKLWGLNSKLELKEKVRSNIVIFGNAYQESGEDKLPSLSEENAAYEALFSWYKECCIELDGPKPEKETFNDNKILVGKESVLFLLKNDNPEDVKEFNDIKKIWASPITTSKEAGEGKSEKGEPQNDEPEKGKIKEGETGKRENESDEVEKLIEMMIKEMGIEKESVFGIDVSLMYEDVYRIEEGQRVISMELYNQLKKNNFKCFLYSAEAGTAEFTENWKKTYRKYYVEEGKDDNNEEIKIYERKEFLRKGNQDVIAEVKRLLNVG